MRRRLAALSAVAIAVGAIALAVPGGASAGNFKQCGDLETVGVGIYNVKAKNVGCKKARAVAYKWQRVQATCINNGSCVVGVWECVSLPIGNEDHRQLCINAGKRSKQIKFDRKV